MESEEHIRRWRLILGGDEGEAERYPLSHDDLAIDRALRALYDAERSGNLGDSAPSVARWLGDIRQYFPSPVVQLMQRDALERLNLRQMLLEPELLEAVEADVHLAATLLALKNVLPERTKETARLVIRKITDELLRRLENPLRQAVLGSLNRSQRNRRPRLNEMDWPRTIRANLKHYQPAYRTVIPETRWGFGHKRAALRDVILCVDQSGSMAASVVYAGVFAAALASLPALRTQVVAFDTAVVNLTESLPDPVEVLFGVQLGGGTDIAQVLRYCHGLVRSPQDTLLILISDLFEGGNREDMLKRTAALLGAGVEVIVLLALDDNGAPAYDHANAAALAGMAIPAFACTPDLFPELMAAAMRGRDPTEWAAEAGIAVRRG